MVAVKKRQHQFSVLKRMAANRPHSSRRTPSNRESVNALSAVYCPCCYEHRSIDPAAGHLRDRCFATARFRCTKIRYTGHVCGVPWVDRDRAIGAAACRRRIPARFPDLRNVSTAMGTQLCADRRGAMVCGEAVALPLQVSRLPQTRVLAHSWPDMASGYGAATGPDGLGECRPCSKAIADQAAARW
jgi:hypothetical protein